MSEPHKSRPRLRSVRTVPLLAGNYCCVLCLDSHSLHDRWYCCPSKHALCRLCYHHLLADNHLALTDSVCPTCGAHLSYNDTNAHPDVYALSTERGRALPRHSGVYVCRSPPASHDMGASGTSTSREREPDVSQEVVVYMAFQEGTNGAAVEDRGEDDTVMARANDFLYFSSNTLSLAGQDFIVRFYVNGGDKTQQRILNSDERRTLCYQLIWLGSASPFVEGKKEVEMSYNVTPSFWRLGREVAGPPLYILQPIERVLAKHFNYWHFEMQEGEGENEEAYEEILLQQEVQVIMGGRPKCAKMPPNQTGSAQVTPCHELVQVPPDIVDALLAKGEFLVRVRMWIQK